MYHFLTFYMLKQQLSSIDFHKSVTHQYDLIPLNDILFQYNLVKDIQYVLYSVYYWIFF